MAMFEAAVLVVVFAMFLLLLTYVLGICLKIYKKWVTRVMLVSVAGLLYPLGFKTLTGIISIMS